MVFTKIFHFANFRKKICEISLRFRFIYFREKCEISRENLQNATKNVRIFREMFRSLETVSF